MSGLTRGMCLLYISTGYFQIRIYFNNQLKVNFVILIRYFFALEMRICAFTLCSNSTYSLKQWRKTVCPEHLIKKGECAYPPPFVLYPFPTEEQCPETRKEWIKAVNRNNAKTKKNWQPSEDSRVCCVHFLEGKPTEAFSSPAINLSATGGENPLKRKRLPPKSRVPYHKNTKRTSKENKN